MINVKSKICEYEGCQIRSSFNKPGQNAKFCAKHKEPDMVIVTRKTCEYEGCQTIPYYNKPGQNARFCAKHKEPDMIDVKSKLCEYEGCLFLAVLAELRFEIFIQGCEQEELGIGCVFHVVAVKVLVHNVVAHVHAFFECVPTVGVKCRDELFLAWASWIADVRDSIQSMLLQVIHCLLGEDQHVALTCELLLETSGAAADKRIKS